MNRAIRFADVDDDDDLDDLEDWSDEHEDEDEDDDGADPEEDELECENYFALTPADTVAILARAALQESRSFLAPNGHVLVPTGQMVCQGCGCHDGSACAGGCFWIAPNVCSNCKALLEAF